MKHGSELCSTCHGSGSIFCVQIGVLEWWNCPGCGGAGVRALFGPPTIHIHNNRKKKIRKDKNIND
jgi:DnaJ-class molecular chaperone